VNNITKERLNEVLTYDTNTQLFTWLISPCNRVKKGDVAGYICKSKGCRVIQIDGVRYRSNTLEHLYLDGKQPRAIYEEKNIPDNSSQDNSTINAQESSRKLRSDNRSGVVGVDWYKNKRQWRVRVNRNHVGYFTSFNDAVIARQVAEHHSLNHGGV